MAKVANVEEVGKDTTDPKVAIEKTKKRSRVVSVKKGVVRFVNLTGGDIQIVSHTLPANGFKEFFSSVGNAMCKVPIVENLVRLKKIEIIKGS